MGIKLNPVNDVAIFCDNSSKAVVNLVFFWLRIRRIGLLFQNLLNYMQSFEHGFFTII